MEMVLVNQTVVTGEVGGWACFPSGKGLKVGDRQDISFQDSRGEQLVIWGLYLSSLGLPHHCTHPHLSNVRETPGSPAGEAGAMDGQLALRMRNTATIL